MSPSPIPVLGFVAPSGSGKTTLLRRLVPILKARGLRIGYLKHAHHTFDLDRPGKDSFELRAAGADATLLASTERWALQVEHSHGGQDPDLAGMLARFPAGTLDLVLVEGFKHAAYPKIEVYRAAVGEPPLYPRDRDIVAVASDSELPDDGHPPVLPLGDPESIARFVLGRLESAQALGADLRPALACCLERLYREGCNDRDSGTASVRMGNWIYLTPEGAAADDLTPDALLAYPLDGDRIPGAVPSLSLHRLVYLAQPAARALLYGRGAYSLGATLNGRPFEPPDPRGRALLGKVPVLSIPDERLAADAPALVAEALARHPIVIVRALGVYAWAQDPETAYRRAATLERSARILAIARQTGAL